MSRAFAYCIDCREMTTGVLDQSKGFLSDASSNHHMHNIMPFGEVADLPRPLFNVITRLGASVPITDAHITLFRLGLDLHGHPTGALEAECLPVPSSAPGAASISPTSSVRAGASGVSTKSPRVSTHSWRTPATGDQLGLDFGEPA